MKVGEVLPNGNTVIAFFEHQNKGICLCEHKQEYSVTKEYVIHRYRTEDITSTYGGVYATDYTRATQLFSDKVRDSLSQ